MGYDKEKFSASVRDATNYLKTGGLGEVIGFTDAYAQAGAPKVQVDTDMAMALCILADAGIRAPAA